MGMTLILIEHINLLIFSFSYQAQNLYSKKKKTQDSISSFVSSFLWLTYEFKSEKFFIFHWEFGDGE